MLKRRIALLAFALLLPAAAQAQDANEEFFAAARKGDVAAVKTFLDKGTDVNAKTRYGATALSYACDKGHIELAKLLIERGANVNAQDTFYNETPLGWAIYRKNVEVIKLLLDKGAKGVDRVLMMGVMEGNKDLVKAALDKGGFMSQTLSTALVRAEKENKPEIVEMLKKAGATPPTEFKIDEETLKSYAGTYKFNDLEMVLNLKDGKLGGGIRGQGAFTLVATSKTAFTLLEVDGITITFNVEGGKVVSLTVNQAGANTKFDRVEQK
jgi:ankyrin repeat protein